mmetsp:Transcript_43177/g.119424  ORF Transcript_43177/g.119424 Transcript_43177/m.119424 type:complete len:210 (+) Transcript_43177:101-730(+)
MCPDAGSRMTHRARNLRLAVEEGGGKSSSGRPNQGRGLCALADSRRRLSSLRCRQGCGHCVALRLMRCLGLWHRRIVFERVESGKGAVLEGLERLQRIVQACGCHLHILHERLRVRLRLLERGSRFLRLSRGVCVFAGGRGLRLGCSGKRGSRGLQGLGAGCLGRFAKGLRNQSVEGFDESPFELPEDQGVECAPFRGWFLQDFGQRGQ